MTKYKKINPDQAKEYLSERRYWRAIANGKQRFVITNGYGEVQGAILPYTDAERLGIPENPVGFDSMTLTEFRDHKFHFYEDINFALTYHRVKALLIVGKRDLKLLDLPTLVPTAV